MAWYTQQLTIENIEVNTSDVRLDVDQVESDLVVQHTQLDTLASDLRVEHPQLDTVASDLRVVHTQQDTVTTALNTGIGSTLTFTRVLIDGVADASPLVLIAALASNYTRLHALVVTMTAAGTLLVEDSDGTDLTGAMPIGANGGMVIPFTAHPNSTLITAVGKGMSLVFTGGVVYGYAIVSQSTTA